MFRRTVKPVFTIGLAVFAYDYSDTKRGIIVGTMSRDRYVVEHGDRGGGGLKTYHSDSLAIDTTRLGA